MFKIFVRNTLEDYSKWRPFFDEHSTVREKYGCTEAGVFACVDHPNEILVETIWENKERAMQFLKDPSLKATMEDAGVIGAPEFSFSE
jgi:quinol monooxygenase YgiN